MSSRELDLISRSLKGDYTLIRSDFSLYERDLLKDTKKFLEKIEQIAKKEKHATVILIGITTSR